MTEVGPADRAKLLRSKRESLSSIVQSRKRKLRELYAVATDEDGIPNLDLSNLDAAPTAPAETSFLIDTDFTQGRRLGKLAKFPRRKVLFDARTLPAHSQPATIENVPHSSIKDAPANKPAAHVANDAQLSTPKSSLTVQDQQVLPQSSTTTTTSTPLPLAAPDNSKAGSLGQNGLHTDLHEKASSSLPLTTATSNHIATNGTITTPSLAQPAHPSAPASAKPRIITNAVPLEHAPGSMDVDSVASPKDSGSAPATADSSRYQDALSSPGSTALSAQTPAVADSANTSPENEGPPYVERADDTNGVKAPEDVTAGDREGERNASNPTADATSLDELNSAVMSGVEAQLLQESAAAQLAHEGSSASPQEPEDKALSPAEARSAGKSSAEALAKPVQNAAQVVGQTVMQSTPPLANGLSPTPGPVSERREASSVAPMDLDVSVPTQPTEVPQRPSAHEAVTKATPTPVSSSTPTPVGVSKDENVAVTQQRATPAREVPTITIEPPAPQATEPRVPEEADNDSEKNLSAPQLKLLANRERDRRRRSVPTVIFGKPAKKTHKTVDDSVLAINRQRPGYIPSDDYFTPLFIEGFTRTSTWMKPIEKLLNQAHKTVSTSDQYLSILDHQACKILRRVYHLQQHDKWSLRQPMRCPEPTRPPSHQDVLLQEMKWMRTDFREERKWKRAVARNLAYACAEWVYSSPEERRALQVNAVVPPKPTAPGQDVQMTDSGEGGEEPLPELDHSDSPAEHEDEHLEAMVETVAPAMIFALQDDEVVFGLQPSKTAELLLENLPMYGSPLQVPKFDLVGPEYDPDAKWKRPAVPLSKFVEGEMVLADKGPPRKRRRFDYLSDSDKEDGDEVIFGTQPDNNAHSQPENSAVALFNPEMKAVRDRLHAGHQFRPPTEYPMPSQSFFECRMASQWTFAEDNQLKSLALEYNYNWSLISSVMSTKSLFSSGAERRTPWECFERWTNLEGLPTELAKTPYFKQYQLRIDNAQRAILQQNQTAQQQVGPNGAVTPVPRRRPTTTMRVERRRNQKHLAMIDAMRKLAKRRETAIQKAQQQASQVASRKVNEVSRQPIPPAKTPRDYSIMRHERDQKLAERMAQYTARQAVALGKNLKPQPHAVPGTPAALAAAQAGQMSGANSLMAAAAAARLNVPAQVAQNRVQARVPMQAPLGAVPPAVQARLNGLGALVPPMAGIPQAQLQAALQAQQRMPMATPQPDLNLVLQAQTIQQQQQAAIRLAQQQRQAAQQAQQAAAQQAHQQVHGHQQQQVGQQQHQPQQGVAQQPQQQPQPQQVGQQPQQHPQVNGTQNSPSPMRSVVNGLNQGAFMANANAQAMMAAFNGGGLATSPGAGLTMPMLNPRVAGGALNPAVQQRIAELEVHYRNKSPGLTQQEARNLAMEQVGRIIVQNAQNHQLAQAHQQAAMSAAAGQLGHQPGLNAMTATTSPHQYASLLRAQQQAQAAQIQAQQQAQQAQQQAQQQQPHNPQAHQAAAVQQAQAQQVAQLAAQQAQQAQQQQQQAAQHQRQASGSATPAPGK
ncbi:RNA polymerase II transcription elongation factor SpEAF [Podospora pseudopauciseta]|uniref:Vacuolar import and degradation protein 21 n=1 Tax=Podospora pseudopauciseta TaxID=2093780 RepID=A0ABR0H2S7_9PEZI|nr:RNA polymerase II transcription elongation factor SpEAF [Podospora pseudopauciseta]